MNSFNKKQEDHNSSIKSGLLHNNKRPSLYLGRYCLLFFLFLSQVFHSNDLVAQDKSWSLEQCIQYALDHNISIKQKNLQTQVHEEQLKQFKANRLPSLNGSASHDYSFGRALDPSTYEYTQNQTVQSNYFSLNASLSLFNGFQTEHRIHKQEFDLRASLKDLERLKNDISVNIASAFLNILFNQEILKLANDQLKLSQEQLERTQVMIDAGQWVRGKLLEAEAQVASDSLQWISASNQLEMSYLNLAQMLEIDTVSGFRIEVPELPAIRNFSVFPPAFKIYEEARSLLPRVKVFELQLESSRKDLDVAKGMQYPQLSLRGSYGSRYSSIRQQQTGVETQDILIGQTAEGTDVYSQQAIPQYTDYPFFDQISDNATGGLSLNLSIPIFNHLQTQTAIKTAQIGVLNSEYSLQQQEKQLLKDIQQAWTDAHASYKQFNASTRAVESARESFRYTEQRYEVGLINIVDYLTMRNQYMRSRSEMLQAKYEYIFKTEILDFYRGKPIQLNHE